MKVCGGAGFHISMGQASGAPRGLVLLLPLLLCAASSDAPRVVLRRDDRAPRPRVAAVAFPAVAVHVNGSELEALYDEVATASRTASGALRAGLARGGAALAAIIDDEVFADRKSVV